LEESFALQRQFIDDVGHELRTPITIVRGHLELLDEEPREREKTMALVMDELDRMTRMVEDLLMLARAQRPDLLKLQSIDVKSFTTDLHGKASALAEREWTLERAGRGLLRADRQKLTQAIVQLAQNAVQHTSRGAEVHLGSEVSDGKVRFWVRDSGPGVPPDEQQQVFERFTRGRSQRRSEGSGLGLAIVKAIAETHGGEVQVASRFGAGATFTVVVPTRGPDARDHEGSS
jgi:two-component system, OmpR family, sensor kinase